MGGKGMTTRITQADLIRLALRLNRETGNPLEPWGRNSEGKLEANIGCFYVAGSHAGACLHQIVDTSGAVRVMLTGSSVPKRELYAAMHAFLDGIEYAREHPR